MGHGGKEHAEVGPSTVLSVKPYSTGCWEVAVSSPGNRAKALGMLLGERDSVCGQCDAFILLTAASLEETGSSCFRAEGSPHG